jgi:carboxymethylenebutenolidase
MARLHRNFFLALVGVLVFAIATPPLGRSASALAQTFGKQKVTFKSGKLTLVGYLFKPDGDGPFPGLIWNHGSEQDPGSSAQFDSVASNFVPAGYVVFAPIRRGHSDSEGQYISDTVEAERKAHGAQAAAKLLVKLFETEQLDDELAGLNYLKSQAFVDTNRLGLIGCSYGGIMTIMGAERGAGYKVAVALSPAAQSWEHNKPLQDRLIKAVSGINIPVFIIHPAKDASLEPGYALGQEFKRLAKPYGLEIFPPIGSEDQQSHCFGGAKGARIWTPAAIQFLNNTLQPGK